MASPDNLLEFLARLYGALSTADLETWASMHADNVVFNVNGSTPVSGRTKGKKILLDGILPQLFTRINPDTARIGINWKCMCADDRRAVVIFEGESETLEGQPYNNRYLQVLEFNEAGLIGEVWEFFDTALAEKVIFTAEQTTPEGTGKFSY
jgi:ketosteroid isomerase-like protein